MIVPDNIGVIEVLIIMLLWVAVTFPLTVLLVITRVIKIRGERSKNKIVAKIFKFQKELGLVFIAAFFGAFLLNIALTILMLLVFYIYGFIEGTYPDVTDEHSLWIIFISHAVSQIAGYIYAVKNNNKKPYDPSAFGRT